LSEPEQVPGAAETEVCFSYFKTICTAPQNIQTFLSGFC